MLFLSFKLEKKLRGRVVRFGKSKSSRVKLVRVKRRLWKSPSLQLCSFSKSDPLGGPHLHIMRVYRQMSHLVALIEHMVHQYVKVKMDYEEMRRITGPSLERRLRQDEEALDDFMQRLLQLVLDEINWNRIATDVRAEITDASEDEVEDEDNDEENINE